VEPTCILSLSALDTPACSLMHDRRPRRTFLHKKRVPESLFPLLPVPDGFLMALSTDPYRKHGGAAVLEMTGKMPVLLKERNRQAGIPRRTRDCRRGCGPLGVGPYCAGHTSPSINVAPARGLLSPCAEHLFCKKAGSPTFFRCLLSSIRRFYLSRKFFLTW
jgi:hypothetical protein